MTMKVVDSCLTHTSIWNLCENRDLIELLLQLKVALILTMKQKIGELVHCIQFLDILGPL